MLTVKEAILLEAESTRILANRMILLLIIWIGGFVLLDLIILDPNRLHLAIRAWLMFLALAGIVTFHQQWRMDLS